MKIRTAVPTWRNLAEVTQGVADIAKAIAAGWNVDHLPDGSHNFPWVAQPYVSTQFGGTGTMTWAVPSVTEWRYRIVGKTMDVILACSGTVGGTPSAALVIQIPAGYRSVRAVDALKGQAGTFGYVDAGTAGTGVAGVSDTRIFLYKSMLAPNWTAGTAQVAAVLRFEVQ